MKATADFCYINGKIMLYQDAKLHISDLGLLRSYGLFDFFRTQNGKPFLMQQHLNRFRKAVSKMGLYLPINEAEIKKIIFLLLAKNGHSESGIKLLLTGGYSEDSITPNEPNFIIKVNSYAFSYQETQRKGVKLLTYSYQRDFPEIKSLNYFVPVFERKLYQQKKAFDILYHHQNEIRELSRSNFFLIKDNVIITPSKEILFGITRQKIMELVQKEFKIEERVVLLSEINSADEAFLTSSGRKILPITKIDNQLIGNGKVGAATQKIMELFATYEKEYSSDYLK